MVLIRTLIQAIDVRTRSALLLDPNTHTHKTLRNALVHRFDTGCKHRHVQSTHL